MAELSRGEGRIMTNCKIHHYERCVGVCASCLRERLLAVIAARESGRTPVPRRDQHLPPLPAATAPPPIFFPRSVSPYSGHRRSVGSGPSPARFHQRFFSTPQVGPLVDYDRDENLGGSKKKFSILTALFGSRNPRSKTGSWIFTLLPGRRKKDRPQFSPEKSKSFPVVDRGMSPQAEEDNDSAYSSDYATESSAGWRRPEPTPVRKFPPASPARNLGVSVSGFAMCLSPLIRPTPKPAADIDQRGGSWSLGLKVRHRGRHERHVSSGEASIGPSRSRKLAEFGRYK